MKRYEVGIIETIELNHVIEIEIPDSNDIETFLEDLTTRKDMDRLKDVIGEVNETPGCKIVNVIEDKNPTGEIEIGDYSRTF
ncbi:hypothetical protein [Clostridium saccharoperbutylacetonicum]|uniref:hypothetical protein n=1 Tax=Clostridium saccharoperbutylacetonicum TaxID=36745 RepID=UPI0039ED208E